MGQQFLPKLAGRMGGKFHGVLLVIAVSDFYSIAC